MPAPIDTAYIEFKPDLTTFEQDAERGIDRALDGVESTVDSSADEITRIFERLGDRIGATFDELSLDVRQSLDSVSRSASTTSSTLGEAFESNGEQAERAVDEFARAANHDLGTVQRNAVEASSALGGLKGVLLGGAAAAGVAGLVAGLGVLTGFGLKSAASLEQTQIAFNSLLGSAEAGQKVFEEIKDFAATTPFEFPEIADAAKRFLAFNDSVGLTDDQLKDYLTTIGNLVSVTGGGAQAFSSIGQAIGQIGSVGKITLENLNQISEAIPGFSAVSAIANATGQTTAEVMEAIAAGEISATVGIDALLEGMAKFPGAAGAMAMQAETLTGVFSTFKDTIKFALADAFAPAIPAVKDALKGITPVIEEALGGFIPILSQSLVQILPIVGQLVTAFAPFLGILTQLITQVLTGLAPAIGPIVAALTAMLTAVQPLIPLIADFVAELVVQLAPALPDIITLISALTQLLVSVLVPILPILIDGMRILAKTLSFIAKPVTAAVEAISDFVGWLKAINWGAVGEAIGEAFSDAWDAVVEFFVGVGEWFARLPGIVWDAISALPGLLVQGIEFAFKAAFTAVGVGIGLIVLAVTKLPGLIIDAISALPGLLGQFFSFLWQQITTAVSTGVAAVVDFFIKLPGRVMGAVAALPRVVGEIFSRTWNEAKRIVAAGITGVVESIKAAPGKIAALGQKLFEAGTTLIRKFGEGLKNFGKLAADIGKSVINFVISKINSWIIDSINSGINFVFGWLPGDPPQIPHIPMLAQGGVAFGPSMIAETGQPEAAIPLDNPRAIRMLKNALGGDGSGMMVTFAANSIQISFEGAVPTETQARRTGEAVGDGIVNSLKRRNVRSEVRTI